MFTNSHFVLFSLKMIEIRRLGAQFSVQYLGFLANVQEDFCIANKFFKLLNLCLFFYEKHNFQKLIY